MTVFEKIDYARQLINDIASSEEVIQLVRTDKYHPDYTMGDAISALDDLGYELDLFLHPDSEMAKRDGRIALDSLRESLQSSIGGSQTKFGWSARPAGGDRSAFLQAAQSYLEEQLNLAAVEGQQTFLQTISIHGMPLLLEVLGRLHLKYSCTLNETLSARGEGDFYDFYIPIPPEVSASIKPASCEQAGLFCSF
jgi:hypothetical protein